MGDTRPPAKQLHPIPPPSKALSINPSAHQSTFSSDYESKMAAKPVALILGAGPRIGISVAKKFASQGYNVAIVSRSGSGASTAPTEGFLSLKADFTKPDSVPALFDAVESAFHAPPSVVVFNAGARTVPPVENNLFSNSAENLVSDFNVNVLSAYIAAQQAVRGWATLPQEVKRTFIYTGNIMNTTIIPMAAAVNLGIGKSASSYWIGLADTLYQAQGSR
jgi:NAD(P)-dependent dehydrogenase (short-subunit alcohol dehydrogenase family)